MLWHENVAFVHFLFAPAVTVLQIEWELVSYSVGSGTQGAMLWPATATKLWPHPYLQVSRHKMKGCAYNQQNRCDWLCISDKWSYFDWLEAHGIYGVHRDSRMVQHSADVHAGCDMAGSKDKSRIRNGRRTRRRRKAEVKIELTTASVQLSYSNGIDCEMHHIRPNTRLVSACVYNIRVNKLLSVCVHLTDLLPTLPKRLADSWKPISRYRVATKYVE